MVTSFKNECKRWVWQLLMAVCSVPYILLLLGLFSWFETKIIKPECSILGTSIGYLLIIGYYFLSVWVHFLFDKQKYFKNSIIFSIRMWIFLLLLSTFYILSFGYQKAVDFNYIFIYEKINLFILFPIASIFFTWWLSELIVRLFQKTRPELLKNTPNQLKVSYPSDLPELPNTLENAIKKALIRYEK